MNKPDTHNTRLPSVGKDDAEGQQHEAPGSFLLTGLSSKLLLLTILFVMLAEIMVFVPSIANFRMTWLKEHLHTAEAVSVLFQKNTTIRLPQNIQDQLLEATGAEAIALRNSGISRLIARDTMPSEIARHFLLSRNAMADPDTSIMDAFDTLINGGNRAIRVEIPLKDGNGNIEVVMQDQPLRDAMLTYARNVMLLSFVISLVTAILVFLAIRWILIRPIQRMTSNMIDFSHDPENTARIIKPGTRNDEIGVAETRLADMQSELQTTLQGQKRLASLGLAVSKINHDLRNILASAQLFSDRLTALPDPTVQRLAPKLIRTIDRAISYTQSVLSYGKAVEAPPEQRLIVLNSLVSDVAEILMLDRTTEVDFQNAVPKDLEINADSEQLFRVLLNLCRNALQAMEQNRDAVHVSRLVIDAERKGSQISIRVSDTGPGVPQMAREKLFEAFSGSTRAGGTGLGLAIAAEIIHAHGGTIALIRTGNPGSTFEIVLPDHSAATGRAARSRKPKTSGK